MICSIATIRFDELSSDFGKSLRIRAHKSKDLRSLGYNGFMGLAVSVFWLTVFSLCLLESSVGFHCEYWD